ncbi:efflux RND transporter periplasmic adaptor subunit [Hydrocarboniphaga effusa]|uniref:efflux RND transporter periplasmic adaptor subunit n=1 Tax=Hydrocarboniphaga effusa TaxID=243629 RepID=UPI003137711E
MSHRSLLAFRLLLATASTSLLLAACGHEEPDARLGPPLVRTAVVEGVKPSERSFTGVVSARVQSNLGFRVPGKIVERLVDTGQAVHRGQALMRIDRTDFALATAALANTVEAARAMALQAAADEQRYRGLVAQGAVSASAYDQTKATADAAAARLKAAEAQADVARNEAGYSVLVADADGVVVETLAEPGQVVTAGQTVVRLAHAGPREALVNLPESLRPAIGSNARASLYDGGDVSGTAQLRLLSDSAEQQTRTYEARYVLQGAAARSPLGSTVTIHIADPRQGSAARVPLSAVFDNGKGPGVWIVEGQQPVASWRAIRIASVGEEDAVVTEGLKAGDRYVTLGAHLIHQNDAVRLAANQGAAQ